MATDLHRRGGWLWRSKQQKRTENHLFTHNTSFDAESEQRTPATVPPQKVSAQEGDSSAEKKLAIALAELVTKEELLRQQFKVAGEAVTGWERAEAEILSLKRDMEEQRGTADLRMRQLDMALKECLKQTRAEQEQKQKMAEAMECRAQEWSKARAEMECREMEVRRRLLESDAQNSAMAKSLQERAKMIAELREGKAMAETEARMLQAKVEAMEKEVSALKYEVHVMSKEADLRNEEKEMNRKAAEAAQKQHLENARKMAHLEADCNRLRALLKKKLPGPAAIAQMKAEADFSPSSSPSPTAIAKQRKKKPPPQNQSPPSASADHESSPHCRDMEFMSERLLCLEEETRRLREVLANHGSAARNICATQDDQQQQQQKEASPVSRLAGHDFCIQSAEIISVSSEKLHDDDDEVSCSESWASALITELDQFKKEKKQSRRLSMDSCSFDAIAMPDSVTEKLPTQKQAPSSAIAITADTGGTMSSKRNKENRATLRVLASRDAQLQSANIMCKDALSKIQLAAKELQIHGGGDNAAGRGAMDSGALVEEAHGIMLKLDRILDDLRIAVATMSDDDEDEEEQNDGDPPVMIKVEEAGRSSAACDGNAAAMAGVQEQLEAANMKIEKQLAEASEELQRHKAEWQESKEVIKKLEDQLRDAQSRAEAAVAAADAGLADAEAEMWKEAHSHEQAKRAEAQDCMSKAEAEIAKLQKLVAELTMDLGQQKKECEALNQKLQGFLNRADEGRSSCRFEWEEQPNRAATKKEMQERDVVAAKEKLSECQRAILMLEKQLTSLECAGNGGIMAKGHPFLGSGGGAAMDPAMNGNSLQQCAAWNNSYGGGGGSSNIQWQQSQEPMRSIQWQQLQEPMNLSHYHMPPLRIHSDIGYGRGGAPAHTYSVADYLHMDEERRLSVDGGGGGQSSSNSAGAASRHSRRQDSNQNQRCNAASVVAQGRASECRPTSFGSRLFGKSNRKQT